MAGARSDDRLQQYFDGELPQGDADALRLELDSDAELRAKLEGLSHLRTLLVAAAEERADELDSDTLFASVLAKLGDESAASAEAEADAATDTPSPARPALTVVQGGKTPQVRAEPPARSSVVWFGVAVGLAVAAAVLLAVLKPFGLGGSATESGDDAMAGAPPPGSEVEEVDFGYSTGAIFSVEGQEGERYAVVWISDEKPRPEDEPLPGADTPEERAQ